MARTRSKTRSPRKPRPLVIPDHLVALPTTCPHGKTLRSFLSAPPGTVIYDPGCKHPKKLQACWPTTWGQRVCH